MFSIFSNVKNIIMLVVGVFGVGYIGVQKYKANKAKDKLQNIETKIAKTNVQVATKTAQAKAQSKKVETDAEIETLKSLTKQSEDTKKEMEQIHKNIETAKLVKAQKKEVKRTTKKFTVEV